MQRNQEIASVCRKLGSLRNKMKPAKAHEKFTQQQPGTLSFAEQNIKRPVCLQTGCLLPSSAPSCLGRHEIAHNFGVLGRLVHNRLIGCRQLQKIG